MTKTSTKTKKTPEPLRTTVRMTPSGEAFAVDILKSMGKENAGRSWYQLKQQHKELAEAARPFQTGKSGRPPEVVPPHIAAQIPMVLNTPESVEYRRRMADLANRYSRGDVELILDMLGRLEKASDLVAIREEVDRRIVEVEHGVELSSVIKLPG